MQTFLMLCAWCLRAAAGLQASAGLHGCLTAEAAGWWLQVQLEGPASGADVVVQLFEARPGDPAVPQGKAFAMISARDAGISIHPPATGVQLPRPGVVPAPPPSMVPASLAVSI